MPPFLKSKFSHIPLMGLLVVSLATVSALAFYDWRVGLVGFVCFVGLFVLAFYHDIQTRKSLEEYVSTLSHRVKKVGDEALLEMPIGIMLINDEYYIEWANRFMSSCFKEESLIGRSLYDIGDVLIPIVKQDIEIDTISLSGRRFQVVYKRDEKLLYFFDVTEQKEMERRYENERTVLAIIVLDNYDEMTQGMDDPTRSSLNSLVTQMLNKWASENGVFLKRVSSDRFLAVFHEEVLHDFERGKFAILDDVREVTAKESVSLTLSMGIGAGVSSFPELGGLAQSSLDLALGRGGDQVAIKQPNGRVKFYGGKTNPMEKRTRVRARVISHALRELVLGTDKVFIMGHKRPDMDAIGSAIGIWKIVQMNQQEGYIVMDQEDIDSGVKRLLNEAKKNPDLYSRMITPEQAMEMATDHSLLIVVDTHKPSLVISEALLQRVEQVVVIDHHRRAEEFIHQPVLVYMEPYASSTAELITELLEYQPKTGRLSMLEATALLAGIIVDTKSFTLRTGSRTFDAASYLRSQGADTVLVQKFLKENVATYVRRAKLIESVYFYKEGIAIATADEGEQIDPVLIAQAADTLLTMDEVAASFVLSERSAGVVGISARSLGEVNVQVIMEALDGGGHLTNAATQLSNHSIEQAEKRLKNVLDQYVEGGEKS
ncbi:DHH family phosphoesterase [Bacillus fonticola]|uniref:DHH family phosphoesterase n=1 Tax=Bacillus fonticola TaxID=2728853 RepID=UPI001474398E|nr:DHH family phosphoesterase [Bacillus fonticola]